jgi:uncharacterized protein involved in exopolysaccharide biosynthesis
MPLTASPGVELDQDTRGTGPDLRADLRMIGEILRRQWPIVVLLIAAGAALGWYFGSSRPRLYEAVAVLSLSAKLDQQTAPSTGNVLPFIENQNLANETVRKFGLDRPPYNISGWSFFHNYLQVEDVRTTSLLRIVVRLPAPQLAADVTNDVAARAVELARTLTAQEATVARDSLKREADEARAALDRSERAYIEYARKAQVEVLKKDVEAMLGERQSLVAIPVDVARQRARLEAIEREIAARQRVTTLNRTIGQDPTLLEAARGKSASDGNLLGLTVRTEEPNRVYDSLDEDAAAARARLAELEGSRRALKDLHLTGAQVAKLNELYEREVTLGRLDLEHDIARNTYEEAVGRFEGARLQVAIKGGQLQIVDSAIPPDTPLPRHVMLLTLAGALVGFVAGVLVVTATFLLTARKATDRPRRFA